MLMIGRELDRDNICGGIYGGDGGERKSMGDLLRTGVFIRILESFAEAHQPMSLGIAGRTWHLFLL